MMSRASTSIPTTDLRILLIEPDEDTRHLLELALSARGHRVTSGADAEAAWHALQQATYPFIVINRRLPDIDGLRLCRQVRTLPGGDRSTVIVISEDANASDRADALEAGANDYLAWPADAIALRAHLEAAEHQSVDAPLVEDEAAADIAEPQHVEAEIGVEVEEVAFADEYAELPFDIHEFEPEAVVEEALVDVVEESLVEEQPADEQFAVAASPLAEDVLFVIAPDGTIRDMTALAVELLGYDVDAVLGTNAFALFHPEDAPRVLSMLTRAFTAGEPEAVELRLRVDDDWPSAPIYLTNRLADPTVQGFAIHVVLPEPEPEPEAELEAEVEPDGVTDLPGFEQLYDELTSLPTFPLFLDRLEHGLARASRRGEPVVTMLLDMDGLDMVDERFGEGASGQLVIAIGQRIQSCLRAGDTVARVAPHEFAIIVEGIIGIGDASLVAKRLMADLEEAYIVSGEELRLDPSLGIAVSVQDRFGASDLLRHARVAREYGRLHPQDGSRHALYEVAMEHPEPVEEAPELILDEESEAVAAPAKPEALEAVGTEPSTEAWFMPLIERISSLEREISRLSSEHAALKEDHEPEA